MGEVTKYFLVCKLWYLQAVGSWLWLAGLAVCRKREGGPLPRSGGGREGADVSQTPYKARLRAVRKAFSQKNAFRIQRSRAQERGLSRGNLSPLTVFWFLLHE